MAGDLGTAVNSIPVFHVHGVLAALPDCPLIHDTFFYRNAGWIPWLNEAAEAIHVTLDEIEDEVLVSGRKAVGEAAVLCFRGFGYSFDNLARLGLPTAI